MSARRKPPGPAAKKAAKPAPNISAIARQHGVSRETVRKLRNNGTDLADDAAVTNGIAVSRAKLAAPAADPTGGESYSEARRRRAVADANFAEVRAKRESGSVIEISEVESLMGQIGAELRSRLLAMRSDMVHELEGRSGPQIYAALDKRVCELLASIENNSPIPKS